MSVRWEMAGSFAFKSDRKDVVSRNDKCCCYFLIEFVLSTVLK